MKYLLIIGFIFLLSCEKGNDNICCEIADLEGMWINTITEYDELIFHTDSILERRVLTTGHSDHFYHYFLIEDSQIQLKYYGTDKVLVPMRTFKIWLNESQDTLIIKGLNKYHPGINGDKFYKSVK
ncbi:MAG: hypothetical protein GX660_24195 [Clostridiaceae bacterium]|nr:hypothetical protein [Clostridiaceae bacterium]